MEFMEFIIRHGYIVLFVWVLAEQLGLPLPAVPVLLAAGALAGAGKLNFYVALLLALAGSLLSDYFWYELGRRRGGKVLNFLCRMSLEPDTCVRKTEDSFAKHGARSLLIAKFVPGLSTVAPPLAGMFHMPVRRFLLFNTGGALLWAGSFMGLGYAFSDQIEKIVAQLEVYGGWLLWGIFGALAAYVAWKFVNRKIYIRRLRVLRITPEELRRKQESGEDLLVLDLRHSSDIAADPQTIPGAFLVTAEDLEEQHANIPRDKEIILFCS
jgi:membrane protein DedA with SNARE-associated domain